MIRITRFLFIISHFPINANNQVPMPRKIRLLLAREYVTPHPSVKKPGINDTG